MISITSSQRSPHSKASPRSGRPAGAALLIDRDYQVQLITHQGRVPFGAGVTHLHRLLRCLAIVELLSEPAPRHAFHAAHSADSSNICIQFRDEAAPPGFDQVLDTSHWRPEGLAPPPLASAA